MEESLEGHREDIVVVAGEAWRQVWKDREDIFVVAGEAWRKVWKGTEGILL